MLLVVAADAAHKHTCKASEVYLLNATEQSRYVIDDDDDDLKPKLYVNAVIK